MRSQLAIVLLSFALLASAAHAFSWGGRTKRQATNFNVTVNTTAPVANASIIVNTSLPLSATRYVKLLARKVDENHPYFKKMLFRVPRELNYGLPGGLMDEFKAKLAGHCNVTNITRIVKNDILLMKDDSDVMDLKDGDMIETTSVSSGPPTRAETARAFAYKRLRFIKNKRKDRRRGRDESDSDLQDVTEGEGEEDRPPRRGGRGRGSRRRVSSRRGAGRSRGRGFRRGEDSGRDIGDDAVNVPDFDGDGEMDP